MIQTIRSPGFGGLELVVLEFHEWMKKHGISCQILCYEGSYFYKKAVERGFEKDLLPVGSGSYWKLRRLIRSIDSQDTYTLIHRIQSMKVAVGMRPRTRVTLLSHTFYGLKKLDFFHQYLYKKLNTCVALTPAHSRNIQEYLGIPKDKITIIPNGINLEKIQLAARPTSDLQAPKILVFGRIDRQKGQDIALKAIKIVNEGRHKKGLSPAHLHIVGHETPEEPRILNQLKELCKVLGLEREVTFVNDFVSVDKAFSEADLFWLPSYQETFGRTILESMAMGVPVVASRAGGVPDIIEDRLNGLLFTTKDPEDLARRTDEIFENLDLYQKIRKQALDCVHEKYDQDKIFAQLFSVVTNSDRRFKLQSPVKMHPDKFQKIIGI